MKIWSELLPKETFWLMVDENRASHVETRELRQHFGMSGEKHPICRASRSNYGYTRNIDCTESGDTVEADLDVFTG